MSLLVSTIIAIASCLSGCHTSPAPEGSTQQLLDCYDYIIVGAGSAGSVLANRLSKDAKYTVLLLEAGDDMTSLLYIPFMAPFAANESNSWGYQTDPQTAALWDFPGHMAAVTQGKVMGGTSSLNSMNFVRGSQHDFNNWAKQYKAHGWSYHDVLKYFKSIENFMITEFSEQEVTKYHGKHGETPVTYPTFYTPVCTAFLEACKESKYEHVDYNGEKHTGYSRVQANILNGMRMGASTCFLNEGVLTRTNLHVSKRSTVTQILFDGKEATGVKFKKDGTETTVKIRREVIVSAGAVGSPKLLMLSGIGLQTHLQQHQINVVENLPVGQGLQDHVVFLGLVVTTQEDLIGLRKMNESIQQYQHNRTGLLTIPGGFEAVLFTHSGVHQTEVDYPDVELELAAVFPNKDIEHSPYVPKDVYERYYKPMIEKNGFMNAVVMVQPESRGAVYLKSKDPDDKPHINPNMLSMGTNDLFRIVNGTMKVKKLFETEAMKKIKAEVWKTKYPRCTQFDIWSDQYVSCMVQHTAFPGQHVCCTCAMGDHDKAVVDESLKVKGISRLRVADSSVMPQIVTGNTNAAVMMIAEKAAYMILQDAEKIQPRAV
uniref:Glucose-methanol-choline oxidoreductase N-terminal domain-containing protein n=1 Tax=Amblyomma maculatum TaxID=34609 RepID=G3MP59_AMBMU